MGWLSSCLKKTTWKFVEVESLQYYILGVCLWRLNHFNCILGICGQLPCELRTNFSCGMKCGLRGMVFLF
jgi:hypothetical protein